MVPIDTHVHIYPGFNIAAVLAAAEQNLAGVGDEAEAILCLTERADCDFWSALSTGAVVPSGWKEVAGDDKLWKQLQNTRSGFSVSLIRGYQIVSQEGIEVLALAAVQRVTDKTVPLQRLIGTVRDSNAVPVVAWSVGKWLGKRGTVVRELAQSDNGSTVWWGDIPQRALATPFQRVLRTHSHDLRVFYGSDPLPLIKEERYVGSFASAVSLARTTNETPADYLRRVAREATSHDVQVIGNRDAFTRAAYRWLRLQRGTSQSTRKDILLHEKKEQVMS